MGLLVRTWNVFHGRTFPESRETHLERIVRIVSADAPDVVALQEVPLWALGRLERWSGMRARWAVTMPALLGPLGGFVQQLDPLRFRSAVTGQANALLVNAHFTLRADRRLVLNPELSRGARLLRWEQRRVCQRLEVAACGRDVVVANLHASRSADQIRRAAGFLADADRCILCGDFNIPRHEIPEFSPPIEGIDQVLVRGLEFVRPPARWEEERRRVDGRLLSDHAPIEAIVAWT